MGDSASATPAEKKSRKSYSLEKKLQCIATAKRVDNIDRAAEPEGVPRTCLTWGKTTKKHTLGRPLKLKEFDKGLAEWVKEGRAHKQKITYKLLRTTSRATLLEEPPPPDLYLEWVLKAWNDGVMKENVINSFKACGIGAIGGADDDLIHCLKEGNGIPNGLYELTKAREAAEAQELAEMLAGFDIEAPDEDDTGHVSDVEVVDDESTALDEENSGSEDENHNLSDDSDF
ncbi:Protein W02H5.4 [Aphelenchoides avenae]|nr:Protein W02H5.4 [Aphelenchus avenae]